ncbi:MAG: septal ring lytic transglycosylase RlpA family protein [Candidatus Peribacteraceae bacterium]|nr:septal ring lytic transglycosylase RlpA family protein [Candidatus Peribacteraceae bacterium]
MLFVTPSCKLFPMRFLLMILLTLVFPVSAFAQGQTVTRRDGFLHLWESIKRPAGMQLYPEFDDVLEGDIGFTEISYAAERNLLDDTQFFYPNDPLLYRDAVLWMFRLHNVGDPEDMEEQDLPAMLARYPLAAGEELAQRVGSVQELDALLADFHRLLMAEVHEVSYYSEKFHGDGTAFGEKFDMYALTAAHRTFPYNTLVRVTNLENDKSVVVRINDRGPYVEGRSMDLSLAAMETIANRSQGVLRNVRLERLGDVDLVNEQQPSSVCAGQPMQERVYQRRITRDVRFHRGIPHTVTVGETLSVGSTKYFVIRSITHPDGFVDKAQQWIGPEERFTFTPGQQGAYLLRIGTPQNRSRIFRMQAEPCQSE